MAPVRLGRPMRVQATAVRPLVEASSLLIVALVLREHRVPARAIARRMGAQPMCHPIAGPVRRARPVRVLGTVGEGDDRGTQVNPGPQMLNKRKNTVFSHRPNLII
jgi:hypothetical protein